MAERSGFFNALSIDGEYDRKYNANDYTENLATIISDGVLRSANDDLKVTASGMTVTVGVGRGWIKGHYYINDTALSFSVPTAPTGGSRYDRVVLRFDNTLQNRRISCVYVQGTAGNNPTKPAPTRTEFIYDLVLSDIYITANATGVTVTDQRGNAEVCGWVYSVVGDESFFKSLDSSFLEWFNGAKDTLSSVTLFKRYIWKNTLTATTKTVQFNIPQYDPETCFVEVYVNGILDGRHTVENDVITFEGTLIAGTLVTVNCYKSIDGTGIESVADEITVLQNQMAAIQGNGKYAYICTGANDNLSLSQIAQAFISGAYVEANVTAAANAFLTAIGGNTYLASLAEDAQIGINVIGKCGISTQFSGDGTASNPKKYFSLGATTGIKKRLIFDFAKCDKFDILCWDNSTNIIFYGNDLNIKNANVRAYATHAGSNITMIKGATNVGRINAENCRFIVEATGAALIAENGTYTNCYCWVRSNSSTAYCFKPRSLGLIRLIGGEYLAYALTSSGIGSAITHTSAGDTDGTLLAFNIHCPIIALTNYTQSFLSVANAGNTYINGVVSRLTSSGAYNEISGQINKSKA